MIIAKLTGGLGNQMFQYAAARATSLKLNQKLRLDISWYREYEKIEDLNNPNKATKRDYLLQNFNINGTPLNSIYSLIYKKVLLLRRYKSVYSRYIPNCFFNYTVLSEEIFNWNNLKDDTSYLTTGYWQKTNYFSDYKSIINKELSFNKTLSQKNSYFHNKINSNNSIGVHIRRGDLITKPSGAELQPTCKLDYFYAGITTIANNTGNVELFLFSDDIDWCKKNFKNELPTIYVDTVGNDCEHFYLLSQCKHQVISNSTFSWWAAWLNSNRDKIVVAPADWYHSKELNKTAIYIPEEWIRINNQGRIND